MLYQILKIWVALAAKIFCRKIIINNPEVLKMEGPLLLAANHPNSFLDAILLDILFKKPVWSLARGDVFKKPFYIKLLTKLKILPVYRTSEGVENLDTNYKTFDACKEIFKRKGTVLMFSEGKCINEWHLRPLKKGTARLAISSWQDDIDVKVLPVSINYSSFRRFGKNIFLNFGSIISKKNIDINESDGKKHQAFNDKLRQELQHSVFEIQKEDKQLQEKLLVIKPAMIFKILFALPALTGLLLNAPLYLPVRYFTRSRTSDTDHYDSVLIALLIFLYPLYLLLIGFILFFFTGSWLSFLAFIVFPFTAWAYVRLKRQLD
ncbi:MAG: 1-acyl-sn-glycerol-3-phosphate acyltransferase [Chitinophagaceae bacterium]